MTAGEFVRRIAALGAARGIPVRFDRTRGKGSHGTLYYGEVSSARWSPIWG